MSTRFRVLTAAAVGLALLVGGTTTATAAPATDPGVHSSARPTAQKYFWQWSDGHDTLSRTFKQSEFTDQAGLPHLLVSVEPASPKRTVLLRFYQDGKWLKETSKKTNSSGEATLDFNPWCDAAETNWCDGTWKYRVSIADVVKSFKIKFTSK